MFYFVFYLKTNKFKKSKIKSDYHFYSKPIKISRSQIIQEEGFENRKQTSYREPKKIKKIV